MLYNFVIHYRTGTTNPADVLLRRPNYKRVYNKNKTGETKTSLLTILETKIAYI